MSKGLGVRAVFCGSGSLLVHCAEAFQAAGGEIVGLISSAAPTCAWAASAGVAQAPEPTEDVFPDTPFELFFSIGYLRVLPSALVGRARKLAVNFHDGPLPGRAGLNAPAWAILDGEREHGISWHEITSELDQGPVLVSRRFPIASRDTAFHLNARCYEEGLSAFQELVDAIQGECVVPVTQDAPSVWRGGADRPRGLGIIDPMGARSDTIRHIRALSFGPYSNPLCLPKLWTGSKLLVVGEGAPEHMELSPGELGLATPDGVHLGQQDGSLRLSGLMDLEGRAISAEREGLSPGTRLPVPPELDAETLRTVGATENTWRETLEQAAPALPAFPRHHGRRGTLRHFPLDAMASESALAAAWLAWVAGVNGGARGSLAIAGETPHPCLSARRPVTLEIVGTPRSLTDAMSVAITHARARAAMAVDLPLRLGSEDARATAQSTLSVVLAEDEISGEPTVALLANPVRLAIALSAYDEDVAVALARDFEAYLQAFLAAPDEEIGALPLTDAGDLEGPVIGFDTMARIGDGLSRHAEERPEAVAVECGGASLSFAALENRVEGLAAALSERGAGPGTVVGVSLPRSPDLVVALFAVLRAGAAYLPLDPEYPASRTQYMVADAGASIVIATPETAERLALRDVQVVGPKTRATPSPGQPGTADDPAYLMYTSGSSGQPKGVVVPHRAVVNVFGSMDALAAMEPGARVLAETSVSFDISVLEIFWTISRGATVVLRSAAKDARRPEFSLFYFGSEASVPREAGEDPYRLLFEGAKFADQNGFSAVWTPERHFHTFGGLYPNPSLTASALAVVTRNVALRAGSVVLPLHHPVRLAEDWALVDNLSNGRAGLALAAGWQPNDFVLRPEAFKDRKVETLSGVKALRALWRGEALDFPGPDGVPVATKVHPCPVQAEIPLWLTAAGNPETFAAAGRLGCGVLTHLLGQTFDELAEKIRTYREAWAEAGHMGAGHVVLMLHTFVGESEEEVLTAAKGPMKAYLDGAVDLVRRAAWSFPTLADRAEVQGRTPGDVLEAEDLSEEETDQLLEHAFERYYQSAGLFGTPESVGEIIEKARSIGADEIGCLIDFGIETDKVLANLPNLRRAMDLAERRADPTPKTALAQDLIDLEITHFQCTPSLVRLIMEEPHGRRAIGGLDALFVGGEALDPDLAHRLVEAGPGAMFNMYGPTETTIWSSAAQLERDVERVPLGMPLANTTLSVRAPDMRRAPANAEGELWIGGAGLADGYWRRPELTAERFVETPEGRFYRTGDLVRRSPTGELAFLGRMDGQVKLRGHRIETGEVEAWLAGRADISRAVVCTRGEADDTRLVAYVSPGEGTPDPDQLKAGLARELPAIMVPSDIVVVADIPLTPNGKLDRKRLLEVHRGAPVVTRAHTGTASERAIAAVWAEALGLGEVPIDGNFFDLGGHSLLVVQVRRLINQSLAVDLSITDLFRYPTVRALAAHLETPGARGPTASDRGSARATARRRRMGRR